MDALFLITQIAHQIGVTFGVGASTFALTFYIYALVDGVIDTSEKRFLRVVYVMLRIGMILITFSLLLFGAIALFSGEGISALSSPLYLAGLTLIGVIIANAILMTLHKMPMRFGPVFAGGSWYSLFFISVLPLAGFSYGILFLFYAAFLIVFFAGFTLIKRRFVKPFAQRVA